MDAHSLLAHSRLVYITQRHKYDVTYLVVIWEQDNTCTDAKHYSGMNFIMCPSVCMGASFEQCGWIKFIVVYLESAASSLKTRVYQIVDTLFWRGCWLSSFWWGHLSRVEHWDKRGKKKLNINVPRANWVNVYFFMTISLVKMHAMSTSRWNGRVRQQMKKQKNSTHPRDATNIYFNKTSGSKDAE